MIEPVNLDTVSDLLNKGYTISVWCHACSRRSEVDLTKLRPDADYTKLRFKCRDCGGEGQPTLNHPMKDGYPVRR